MAAKKNATKKKLGKAKKMESAKTLCTRVNKIE